MQYVDALSVEPFEQLLSDVLRRPKSAAPSISDSRRKLAALRLKQRKAPSWFPTLLTSREKNALRLFCFPHAGGGTRLYRGWSIEGIEVCPVLLPGRESRAAEASIDNMKELIEALSDAIRPYAGEPYAFFGHSMGAGMAFELARVLEREPRLLIVSGARAPQYRINLEPRPDPPDEVLLEQLSAHGTDREALEAALPLLRADTRLYRNYRFVPGPPLGCPIAAYGGTADAGVHREDLAGWAELTSGNFTQREFAGGHFYLESVREPLLRAIAEDLASYAGV